ncbi:tetratricopeptide repeat protein [Flagellimonas sp.]|uniref:tetratricopeptide repeat protein n=1 Tax=Flagellimonas sp. TaxID=2058762 RepID=UPI003F4A110F
MSKHKPNNTPDFFDLLEDYLNGNLSKDEKLSFEEKLNADPSLKNELEKHKLLHEAMADFDAIDFRKRIQEVERGFSVEQKKKRNKWLLRIAASLIIIAGVGIVWTINESSEDNLFKENYAPYPVEDVQRGSQEKIPPQVLNDYSSGKYGEIVSVLELLVQKYPEDDRIKMYLGTTYLEENRTQEALSVFKTVDDRAYGEHALWYISLCYLNLEDRENCIKTLDSLITYNGIYQNKALRLKKELIKSNSNTTDNLISK